MQQTPKKTQPKVLNSDSLLEQLRGIGQGVAKTLKDEVVSGVTQDALSSLFGPTQRGDMQPGQAVTFPPKTEVPPQTQTPSEMPEFMPFPPRFMRRETRPAPINTELLRKLEAQEAQVAQKIEEVRQELKALLVAVRTVDHHIAQAIETPLVDPGVYHLNFLDRLKTILKLMRQNLNSSSSWLSTMRSRKKERKYWSMYKRKGTQFGLSSERVVSTQVG